MFLAPYDSGNTRAIYNYAASPGGIVQYWVTDPAQTLPASSVGVVGGGSSIPGNANQLWVFIPSTNIETNP
jgi:hypothetical protein